MIGSLLVVGIQVGELRALTGPGRLPLRYERIFFSLWQPARGIRSEVGQSGIGGSGRALERDHRSAPRGSQRIRRRQRPPHQDHAPRDGGGVADQLGSWPRERFAGAGAQASGSRQRGPGAGGASKPTSGSSTLEHAISGVVMLLAGLPSVSTGWKFSGIRTGSTTGDSTSEGIASQSGAGRSHSISNLRMYGTSTTRVGRRPLRPISTRSPCTRSGTLWVCMRVNGTTG